MEEEKIGVNIYYFSPIEGNLEEILFGLEEEGLPYITTESIEKDARLLGKMASSVSKLGVGIGIGRDEISLSYEKLPADKPVFIFPLNLSKEKLRILGMNGARLIKGEPFIIPKGDE